MLLQPREKKCIEMKARAPVECTQTISCISRTQTLRGSAVLQVTFEIADITTADSRAGFYDVIYSRDTILHIENKAGLFCK